MYGIPKKTKLHSARMFGSLQDPGDISEAIFSPNATSPLAARCRLLRGSQEPCPCASKLLFRTRPWRSGQSCTRDLLRRSQAFQAFEFARGANAERSNQQLPVPPLAAPSWTGCWSAAQISTRLSMCASTRSSPARMRRCSGCGGRD